MIVTCRDSFYVAPKIVRVIKTGDGKDEHLIIRIQNPAGAIGGNAVGCYAAVLIPHFSCWVAFDVFEEVADVGGGDGGDGGIPEAMMQRPVRNPDRQMQRPVRPMMKKESPREDDN